MRDTTVIYLAIVAALFLGAIIEEAVHEFRRRRRVWEPGHYRIGRDRLVWQRGRWRA